MKDLPSVTAFAINENLNNCQESYHNRGITSEKSSISDINKKINNIFSATDHVYKSKVIITYADHEQEEIIVGKTAAELITITGNRIKIIDIFDIKKNK